MKTIMTILFLLSGLTANAQVSHPHYSIKSCDGMLYVDVVPQYLGGCEKIGRAGTTHYCCSDGGIKGYYEDGEYHYYTTPTNYTPYPSQAVECEEAVVCRQVDVYQHSCRKETVCSKGLF